MVKGFSTHEKKLIRHQLIEKSTELFSIYGLQKTSISQITKKVGISQGTFYLFFSSKEELFFHVIQVEEDKIKNILQDDLDSPEFSVQDLTNLLLKSLTLIENSPVLLTVFEEQTLQQIMRKVSPELLRDHFQKDESLLAPLINRWQKENVLTNYSIEVITGALRAFVLLLQHKKEIGEQYFLQTMNFLAKSIANELLRKGE
ncbi:TetR/AcrR family transcriptional regulator [Bacillus sp. 2205SS5-2]|uniref:TetR/AcrR family transcriptional regulator n=1 Tax=Bacillus sp. 2205SS5-2 TaxID=3109031 RepID=UPI00300535A8